MWYAVYEHLLEYVKGVYSAQEYNETFGAWSADYRPRYRAFATEEEACAFMESQNAAARRMYGLKCG